jgi:hypothetical protein
MVVLKPPQIPHTYWNATLYARPRHVDSQLSSGGGHIQFWGLYPPLSEWTSTDPSPLNTSSRTASGSSASRRPE